MRTRFPAPTLLLAVLFAPAPGAAIGFTLTRLASTGEAVPAQNKDDVVEYGLGTFGHFESAKIDDGVVAFHATGTASGQAVEGVYLAQEGYALRRLADSRTTVPGTSQTFGNRSARIGDYDVSDGKFAFSTTPPSYSTAGGIYGAYRAEYLGGLETVFESGDIPGFPDPWVSSIDYDQGIVTMTVANRTSQSRGVFQDLGDIGFNSPSFAVSTGSVSSSSADSGLVACEEFLGVNFDHAIRLFDGGQITTLVHTDDPVPFRPGYEFTSFYSLDDDADRVVFNAGIRAPNSFNYSGLYLASPGGIERISDFAANPGFANNHASNP